MRHRNHDAVEIFEPVGGFQEIAEVLDANLHGNQDSVMSQIGKGARQAGRRLHLRDGVVYRNGEALDEPYVLHDRDSSSDFYRNNFPAVPPSENDGLSPNWSVDLQSNIQGGDLVVPPGHYFAMGDHRGVSLDSRYWGFIPQANVIGRPMFIYWSFQTPEDQYRKTGWSDRALFLGQVVLHFFDETRWKRTLQVVK